MTPSSFAQTAREIFDETCRITGASAGYVALLTDDGAENEVLFLEAGGAPCTVDPKLPMPIRGLRAEAYESRQVVFDNDFMNGQWVRFMPEGHANLRNVMFAPLNIEGKIVGVMGLANKDGDFTDHDAQMAAAFADFAALALHNSRSLETLRDTVTKLETALDEVKTLRGIIPICASCKKVRDDQGFWSQVEEYISKRTGVDFTHGLCPECAKAFMEEVERS